MSQIPSWRAKFDEAEFFFFLMKQHFDSYEFQYFVSAFLSAIQSAVEHNRLHSNDGRFKDWYRDITTQLVDDPTWELLRELRNKEVHQKGTDAWQQVGMSFPEGIQTKSLELRMDFSSGKPVASYKSAEMEDFATHPVEQKWVWKTVDEPNVMELCTKGLDVLQKVMQSRSEMKFSD